MSSSIPLLIQAVLVMAVIPAPMAMPTAKGYFKSPVYRDKAFKLLITSNIEPGIPYDGGMGPFIIGENLTITCSTENSKVLSWWEGEKQLDTVVNVANGIFSCNLTVGILQAEDSLRHFTCRVLGSGIEKSVDLHLINDYLEIQNGGHPLKNEQGVKVFAGMNFSLDCIVNGYNPSSGSWWDGKTKLPSKRTKSPNAILNQLTLGPASIEDNGRQLTCRARNGQLSKTVVLNVLEERENGAPPTPSATSEVTITTTPPSSSTKITIRNISSISEKLLDEDVTLPKVSPEKSIVTAGANERVSTPTPDGQGPPVSETVSPDGQGPPVSGTVSPDGQGPPVSGTVSPDGQGPPVSGTVSRANPVTATSKANPVTATTTEQPQETNDMKNYFIVEGLVITIGVGILILVILKLRKTKKDLYASTSTQQNSSKQRALRCSSVQNTNESLDSQDLPPIAPLLPRPPPVKRDCTPSGSHLSCLCVLNTPV